MKALDSLIDDFVSRLRRGDEPEIESYILEHPELAAEILEVFPALRLLEGVGVVAPESPSPSPPRQLGEYIILREVGRGGMGVVYEAVQQSLGRHVALKVLAPGLNTRPVHFERFRREARAVAGLHHTNIVPVFGVGEQEGVHFYAMQFIRGQTLSAVIAELQGQGGSGNATTTVLQAGEVDAGEFHLGTSTATTSTHWSTIASEFFQSVAGLGAQAADALEYAHRQGIIHRDIKPGNLLLDTAGTLWVTDFGLAKATESEALTATGDVLGTLAYMAPEQLEGKADARTDVYGLGLALYELATLTPAFRDEVRIRLIDKVRRGGPPAPRSIEPRIPLDLQTIIQKAIAPNPGDRYSSAATMAEDLRRFHSGRAILARRTTWAGQAWRWGRRNPAVASLLAAVSGLLIVLAIGASLAAFVNDRESRRARKAEAEANDRAWRSQLAEARAITTSGRLGQRFEALRVLRTALDAARAAGPLSPDDEREFRNVAVAATTLPDAEHLEPALNSEHALLLYTAKVDADGTVRVYRNNSRDAICELRHPKQTVAFAIDARSGRLAVRSLGGNSRIAVWDTSGPKPIQIAEFKGNHRGRPILSTDNQWVACAVDRTQLKVLDVASHTAWTVPVGEGPDSSYAMAFSPGGALTYPYFDRGAYQLRRWRTGNTEDLPVPPADGRLISLAWDEAGQYLAVADDSRYLRVWNTRTGAEVGRRREHSRRGFNVYLSPRGTHVLSVDSNNILRIWEVGSGRLLVSTTVPTPNLVPMWEHDRIIFDSGNAVRFDPGRELVQCVHLQDGEEWGVGVEGAWFSPTDNLIATSVLSPNQMGNSNGIVIVDPETGLSRASILHLDQRPKGFRPDGTIVSSGFTGLEIWPRRIEGTRVQYGPSRPTIPRQTNESDAATWQGRIAVYPKAPSLRFVHPDRADVFVNTGLRNYHALEVSADGQWCAVGSSQRSTGPNVRIYRTADAALVAELEVETPTSLGFSADGNWLWAGSKSACLWRVGTWEPGPTIGGRRLAMDSSGKLAAADEGNGCIRLIDLHTSQELVRLQTPAREPLLPLSFSADGRRLAAVSFDTRTLFIWDLSAIHQGLIPLGLQWSPAPPSASMSRLPAVEFDEGELRDGYRAMQFLEERMDFASGVECLKKAVADHPSDFYSALRLVQICTLGPNAVRDLRLAEEVCNQCMSFMKAMSPVEQSFVPRLAHFQSMRAAIEYRHGHYDRAIEWLDRVEPAQLTLSTSGQTLKALTLHRLGRTQEAKTLFEVADERLYWNPRISRWLLKLTRDLREEPGNPPAMLRR